MSGIPKKIWGESPRKSSCTVRGLSEKLTTPPLASGMCTENICSATWHSDRNDTTESLGVNCSAESRPRAAVPRPRQDIMAALDRPG